MKCIACDTAISAPVDNVIRLYDTSDGDIEVQSVICPHCKRPIIRLCKGEFMHDIGELNVQEDDVIYPLIQSSVSLDQLIPRRYADELIEARSIIELSPKSSAALGRRCLQGFIREEFGIHQRTLFSEVEELITRRTFPTYINETLHAMREIGNFAAHPLKDTSTGEIVEVEPGEAEWILDLLLEMFRIYFVHPQKHREKIDGVNGKLRQVGKSPV